MTDVLLRRIAARAIDAFTVLFLTFGCAVTVFVLVMDPLTQALDRGPWGATLATLLLYGLIAFVYETVFVAHSGQTPGKDLMKIRVVDAATGDVPTWSVAARRAALMGVARFVPGVALGTIAPLAFAVTVPASGERRGVHDLLCRTAVEYHDASEVTDPRWAEATADLTTRYGPRSWWQQVSLWMEGGR